MHYRTLYLSFFKFLNLIWWAGFNSFIITAALTVVPIQIKGVNKRTDQNKHCCFYSKTYTGTFAGKILG